MTDMSLYAGPMAAHVPPLPSDPQPSRKRPRSTSPGPLGRKHNQGTADSAAYVKQLADPKQRNQALNALMKVTASHEINYTVEGDDFLQALVDVVEYDEGQENEREAIEDMVAADAWNLGAKKPRFPESTITVLHAVLVIFRNLSFVSANLRPMTQAVSVMALLTHCLYLENAGDLLLHAVQTLTHLAPVIDVTGQRILADKLFLDTADHLHKLGFGGLQFAKQLDDLHQVNVAKQVLWEGTQDYVTQIWQLFAGIHHVIVRPCTPRPALLQCIDLIKELLEHDAQSADLPSMNDIFKQAPPSMMQRMVDCLWIPRLGPDSLDYINPVTHIVSRVSTLKLFMGYDATVDTELRDRALEVLQQLLEIGVSIPAEPRLYNALLPCLQTKVGRNDARILANGILKTLGKSEEHQDGLLYSQERLLELATQDTRIAQVVLSFDW